MIFTPEENINIKEMKSKGYNISKSIMTEEEIEAIQPNFELGIHTEQCCRLIEVLGGEIIKGYNHPFYYSRGFIKFKNWNKEIMEIIVRRQEK